MKTTKRALAMLLCLIMALSLLPMVASAAGSPVIDTTQKGTLTIHKFEYNGTDTPAGNGVEGSQRVPHEAVPLQGVEFSIYKIKDVNELKEYYSGANTEALNADDYLDKNGDVMSSFGGHFVETLATNEAGLAVFDELDLGIYLVVESYAPDTVTIKCDPFLVSLPMTDPINDTEWRYNVDVYPKNATSKGNIELKKLDGKDGTTPVEGAVFSLAKLKEGGNTETADDYVDTGLTATTNAAGIARFADLADGFYEVRELSAPNGYIVDKSQYARVKIENNKCAYYGTSHDFDITSDAGDTIHYNVWDYKPAIQKRVTMGERAATPGKNVEFALKVTVPQNIKSLSMFNIEDVLEDMAPVMSSVDVTWIPEGVSHEQSVDDSIIKSIFQPNSGPETGGILCVYFNPKAMESYAGKEITIRYQAVVNASSVTHGYAKNEARLNYTSVIAKDGIEEKIGQLKDTAYVYNFGISVQKVANSADGAPLEGVQFELYQGNSPEPLKFTKHTNGYYYVNADGTDTLTTDDGHGQNLSIRGLSAGTYHLKEIKTVDGYNLLSQPVDINLNFTVERDGDSFVYKIGGTENMSGPIVNQTVINKKGFTLPQTGGIGALMFILIGGVLVGGGVALMNGTDKKRAR